MTGTPQTAAKQQYNLLQSQDQGGLEFPMVTSSPPSISPPPLPKAVMKSIPAIYEERLVPLDLRFGIVREILHKKMSVAQANQKAIRERQFASRAKASVCFVIRKPGCIICKEQGQILSNMISSFSNNKVTAWAVIKEINVDNDRLLEMYQKHFNYPFFLDSKKKMYKALGNRKPNFFKVLLRMKQSLKRIKSQKHIEGTIFSPGEGITLGGILIFDEEGQIRYAFHEKSGGTEFPIDQIRAALNMLVDGDNHGGDETESSCK